MGGPPHTWFILLLDNVSSALPPCNVRLLFFPPARFVPPSPPPPSLPPPPPLAPLFFQTNCSSLVGSLAPARSRVTVLLSANSTVAVGDPITLASPLDMSVKLEGGTTLLYRSLSTRALAVAAATNVPALVAALVGPTSVCCTVIAKGGGGGAG